MLRGFLSGIFWGSIIAVVVLAVASLLAPLPATVIPQTSAVEGTAGAEGSASSGTLAGVSRVDEVVEDPMEREVAAPSDGEKPPLTDTASAPKPVVIAPEGLMVAPAKPETGGAVNVESESPILPNPQVGTPTVPAPEEEPSISTNPPQPQVPEAGDGEAFPTPVETGIPELKRQVSSGAGIEEGIKLEVPEDMTPTAEAGAPSAVDESTSQLKSTGKLIEAYPQYKSDRLPTVVGKNPTEPIEAVSPRPVIANAEQTENIDDKPVLSIVLLDEGDSILDINALASFPYPLSIAISTLDAQAKEKAVHYRSKGIEVLAMIDIPNVINGSDVEVAMDAHLLVMPEAVGVIEGLGDGLQSSKIVSDQVTAILAASGHGLVMFPNGLNTAQKLAAKEGVPSATVFRDFDGKGQSEVVIRRFLDQAAFKAGQTDGVVMFGRLSDETVAALLLWGLQDRAGTVALSPVSAALQIIN